METTITMGNEMQPKRSYGVTPHEPQVNATDRYTIGQAAAVLGVNRCTLRRYTDQRLIKCGFLRRNGRRFYTGQELLRFWRAQA